MAHFNANLASSRDEYDSANAGIRSPRVITLNPGEVVMRFATAIIPGTTKPNPESEWAHGAWWIRERDFYSIIDQSKYGTLPLGFIYRSALAVMPSWSDMGGCVKAIVAAPVDCYAGRGRSQYREQLANGMMVTLHGWPDVEQLYVPNMRRARKPPHTLGSAVSAFTVVETMEFPQPAQLR